MPPAPVRSGPARAQEHGNGSRDGRGAAQLASGRPGPRVAVASMTAALEIAHRALDEGRGDLPDSIAVAGHQGAVTHEVDDARDAVAVLMDLAERGAREGQRPGQPRDAQAVLHVTVRLLARQRLQIAADADALVELAQLVELELLFELGLAHEQDLQELARGRLEVGEDADLLERLHAHLLRLVDDHEDRLALAARGEKVLRQCGEQLALAGAPALDAQVVENGPNELGVREVRVQHERALHAVRELAQEGPAERGLARAHITHEGHEPFLARDAVEEGGEDLVMALGPQEEARIRREDERWVLEAVERLVHLRLPRKNSGRPHGERLLPGHGPGG